MTGQRILVQQFDGHSLPTLTLVVEIAWGADLTDTDGSGWTWTDVTDDVRLDPGVAYTIGRGDEASTTQPAQCTFNLDNRTGAYSQSPLGAHWPYVRKGTPVRVRMILGTTTSYTRFQGYATSFTPSWDPTGKVALSAVTANGVLRRLQQGTDPLQSALRHSIPGLPHLIAYWPLEDGKSATSAASGLDDGQPMTVVAGTPAFANSSPFDCSDAVPQIKDAYLLGYLTNRNTNGVVQMRAVIQWPESSTAAANNTFVLRAHLTGTLVRLDVVYLTGGALKVLVVARDGTTYDSGPLGFDVDGQAGRLSVYLQQSGSNVEGQISWLEIGAPAAGYIDLDTITGQTLTGCYSVAIAPDRSQTNLLLGHVTVEDTVTDIFDLLAQLNAYVGETAAARFTRLCGENGLDAATSGTLVTGMGAQSIDTLVNLLREIETANFGLLVDGLSPGLKLFDRVTLENAAATVTLDVADDELPASWKPVDDDQLLKNRWTVTRKNGASATSEDTTGPLGTQVVGVYADSKTVNLKDDSANQRLADWLVHQFTVDGYRYPALPIDFHVTPELAEAWLASTGLWTRIDLTNVAAVLTQMPPGDISLLVQGFTETISQFTWSLDANCSAYDPWRIATVAAETGDTSEFLMRLDTDDSSVHTTVAAGATSISVDTNSGPLWTTAADDMPLDVEIAGIRVHVTDVTGSSSPQTFAVDGSTVTKTLTAGTSVSVWRPPVLGL